VIENNQVVGLDVKAYIDVEEFDRPTLFKVWDNIMSAANHINSKIGLRTIPGQIKDVDTSAKSMYS